MNQNQSHIDTLTRKMEDARIAAAECAKQIEYYQEQKRLNHQAYYLAKAELKQLTATTNE